MKILWINIDVLIKEWEFDKKTKHRYFYSASGFIFVNVFKSQISDMFINLRFVVLYFSVSLCVCVFDIKINEFDVFQYAVCCHHLQWARNHNRYNRIVSKSVWKHGVYKIYSQSYTSVNNHYFSIWFHLVCFYFCDCLFMLLLWQW